MSGTVLKDDLQSTIEDQLTQYANSLGQAAGGVQKAVGDTWEDLQRAGRTSVQDVQAQLADYATQAYNQAQQALQDQQQQAAQQAQAVQQHLTDYATQVAGGAQATQLPQGYTYDQTPAGQQALPHAEEPATQTDVGQTAAGASPNDNLASQWKTQFDFGATYTGDYRTGTPHRGVDLVPASGKGIGTEVDAFAPGTVTNVFRDPGGAGGLIVYVQDSDGLTHAYMHLNSANVKVGDQVQRGTPIATMGESGTEGSPHLHYEVRKNASNGDPLNQLIDPRPYESGAKQPGQTQGPVQQAVGTGQATVQATANRIGQGKDDFLASLAPLAKQFSDSTGIDPSVFLAIGANETGWGRSQTAQQQNNIFSIQGSGANGSRWAGYDSPQASFQAFVDLVSSAPRYAQAWADRHNPGQFINDLRNAGYVVDEPGYPAQGWVDQVTGIYNDLRSSPIVAAALAPVDNTIAGARQGAQDVLTAGQQTLAKAPIVSDARDAVAGAREQLQAIQDQVDRLRTSLEQANQPPLVAGSPARQAIDQGIAGAQQAVGSAFSGLGTAANQAYETAYGTPEQRQARSAQYLQDVQAAGEAQNRQATEQVQNLPGSLPGIVAGGIWNAFANPSMGITWDQYRAQQDAKNKWIEENNPAKDVLLVGGLTSGIAQQLTDPLQVLAFGPTMGAGRAIGAGIGETVAQQAGRVMAPEATRFVSTIAEKLTGGALANGVQNALFEVDRPDATPESIGQAFVSGAALGGLMDVGTAGAARVIRGIGQQIIDRAPELLRSRQPAQAQVGAAIGLPARGDVLEGQAVPRPGYEPGTPEFITESMLQDRARAQGTQRPNITQADIQSLPGLGGSRTRSLDEVRQAVEAGLPAARWYSEIVQQVRQDTGQNINPREAAVLMGAFGGNAGVPPNYHAMLSVFDAMRQAKPDLTGFENMTRAQIVATPAYQAVEALLTKDAAYADRDMLARVMRGYRTGEIPVPTGAKLSSYTQNFLHALNDLYDPYSTQDVWQGRLFGSRLQSAARGADVIPGTPDVSGSDQAYRSMHALTNWIAREMNISPREAQAAGWGVFRTLWNDPVIGPGLRTDQVGLSDAIAQGYASGVLHPPSMLQSALREVTGAPTGNPASWLDKIDAIRQRIRSNGSYDAPPPNTATAIAEWALFHPSRPGFEYLPGERISGVSGRGRGAVARPVGNGPAAALRDLATLDSPIMRVPGEVPLDANGKIPWLLPEHDVQRLGQHTYVNVVGIGDEGAQLVGRRLGADVYNHADPNTTSYGGLGIDGLAGQREQAAVASALQARGLPVLREQVGTGVRVPLTGGKIGDLARTVQDVLNTEGLTDATVGSYTGETHAVGSGRARVARGAAAAARALGLPAGNDIRGQQLAAGLFRDAPIPAYPGATPPGLGGVGGVASRQRAQAQLPFAINLGGAAVGGAAGAAATPEGAPPEERLRNIGLGASAGLLGTAALTRGLRPLETAPGRVSEGFRAPERPTGLELRATTQEPPGGPGGPGERPPTTVSGGVPRSLEQVHSNPYAMREAGPGETPMTSDEMLSYADELERRYEAVQNRRDAIDEMIRNPGQKIDRPRWAAGLTNDQVAEIARAHGASPYEEGWADRVGLEEGSGEVRYALREGGYLGDVRRMSKTPTPAELRAERTRLDAELGDIQSAHEQMANAPAEPNLVRVRSAEEAARAERPAELPFDTGAPDETPASVAEAQGGLDEGARLAQEIVLSKGRGTLRSDQGTVSLEQGNVRSTALVSNEEIQRATEGAPSARTEANMPNLNAMLEGEPEIAAQIRKAADDNPDLFEAYRQGRISMDSLRNDLAKRVGMTVQDWNKTKIGQGFNEREMVALQAAAVEQQGRMMDTAQSIVAKGGVDALTPEELVFSAATLADATKILAVARGGRSTAGRTLNALKQRFDRTMASGITAANERLAAQKTAAQARRAAARATTVLAKGRELEREATTARAEASRNGAPRNILQQIDQAYAELDRYNAMTLHEKGAEFDRLKAERAKRAAERKAKVRSAPEELLGALRSELKAEQDNFARRKDTWETMAFWDSKAAENAMAKRTAFRGQLYIEQQRKVANIAAKEAEKEQARAFDAELQRRGNQSAKAERLLESIGGREVTAQVLKDFVAAMSDPSPDAAAKFLKGMAKPSNWARATTVRLAGLLSGPITHIANMGGNTARAMVEVPVRATTVGIDAARAAITGGERQAYMAELQPMIEAWAPGFYAQLPNAVKVLRTGISPREAADLSRVRAGFGSGSAVVDATVEMPLRLLQAEDVLFRGAAYAAHANRVATREAIKEGFTGNAVKSRAANIIANLEEYPDLAKEVEDNAAHMVFQEKRRGLPLPQSVTARPGSTQAEIGRFARSQVLPFMETPANITAQGFGMSPLGLMGSYEAARGVAEMPTGTRAERYARGRQVLLAEERAARAIVGTGIFGAGVALGLAGMLTAAYSEDPNVNSTYPQGWRPWSFRLQDPVTKNTYYIPLQNLAVVGAPLAMAAILTDPTHHGKSIMDPEEFGMAATGIGKYVLDNTFLQGMSDFVDLLQDPNARGGKFLEGLTASYGPYSALGREIQRFTGVATRNPREGIRGLIDAMEANYPGLSGNVPPSLTPMGDERTQGVLGPSRYITPGVYPIPGRFDIERDEPTLRTLRQYGVGVPKVDRAINIYNGSIPLNEDERAQLTTLQGQMIRQFVAQAQQEKQWSTYTDADKAAAMRNVVQEAARSARLQFIQSLGDQGVTSRWSPRQAPEPYYLGAPGQ